MADPANSFLNFCMQSDSWQINIEKDQDTPKHVSMNASKVCGNSNTKAIGQKKERKNEVKGFKKGKENRPTKSKGSNSINMGISKVSHLDKNNQEAQHENFDLTSNAPAKVKGISKKGQNKKSKKVRFQQSKQISKKIIKKTKELRIMYTNPNGALGKIKSIETAAHTANAHFVTLSETNFGKTPLPITGYSWYNKPRKEGGGGVAIAVRDDIHPHTNRVQNLEDQSQEIIWVELSGSNKRVYVGCYYGKQESHNVEEVKREFSQIQTQFIKLSKKGSVILTGDFNAKLRIELENVGIIQQQSRNGEFFQETLDNSDAYPVSIHADKGLYTWVNRPNPVQRSVIDYIVISDNLTNKVNSVVVDEEGILRVRGLKTLTTTLFAYQ